MLRKKIKYVDFNDVEREEDFYFNLSKAELMEMELGTTGGFSEMVKRIVAAQDQPTLMKIFKDFILKAYGEKTADGKRFMKIDENGRPLAANFEQTEAYSVLYMELITNADAAAEFINGVVPADIAKQAAEHPMALN